MRGIEPQLEQTLSQEKKMGFIVGPRQVGKTTLSINLLEPAQQNQAYFNWDIPTIQKQITRDPVNFWHQQEPSPKRIVLDEIHKYPRWKRFLKGFFDANKNQVEVIVTGSGRLDVYQRGGDSLFGRYHLYHLMPYSLGELIAKHKTDLSPEACLQSVFDDSPKDISTNWEALWQFNGFPEPLFAADKMRLNRWRNDHNQLILREDLRDLTQIREIGLIETMVHLLPERVGSPLSVNALREDLGVNHKTAQNWLNALDRLYYLFFLTPYANRLARTLKKEEKVYFYDWSEMEDEGKRFENLIAVHLLKACLFWTDVGYGKYSLHYIRDKEKREVDFVICENNKAVYLIEAKLSDTNLDRSVSYFHERLKPRYSFQLVKSDDQNYLQRKEDKIFVCSVSRFLAGLP